MYSLRCYDECASESGSGFDDGDDDDEDGDGDGGGVAGRGRGRGWTGTVWTASCCRATAACCHAAREHSLLTCAQTTQARPVVSCSCRMPDLPYFIYR